MLHDQFAMSLPQAEMNNAKLDLGYRDFCAHLLIPLNECRRASYYMPWSCGEVRSCWSFQQLLCQVCSLATAPARFLIDVHC